MERFPEHEYLQPHRPPPPVPYYPYSNAIPQQANDSCNASETGSLNVRTQRRRGGSFGKLFRFNSSDAKSQLQLQQHIQSGRNERARSLSQSQQIYPSNGSREGHFVLTAAPTGKTDQEPLAEATAGTARKRAFSASRTVLVDGRKMLRKVSSRMRSKGEEERLEQERKARNATPPSLPVHNPLPSIDNFSGANTYTTSTSPSKITNFSRLGTTMPSSNINSSSSPLYAVRPGQTSSPAEWRTNGEYVTDTMSRTESITNRGRSSYASSIVGNNVSSPRRIRRRKDPTPFK